MLLLFFLITRSDDRESAGLRVDRSTGKEAEKSKRPAILEESELNKPRQGQSVPIRPRRSILGLERSDL
jgi:hypothetical protein